MTSSVCCFSFHRPNTDWWWPQNSLVGWRWMSFNPENWGHLVAERWYCGEQLRIEFKYCSKHIKLLKGYSFFFFRWCSALNFWIVWERDKTFLSVTSLDWFSLCPILSKTEVWRHLLPRGTDSNTTHTPSLHPKPNTVYRWSWADPHTSPSRWSFICWLCDGFGTLSERLLQAEN